MADYGRNAETNTTVDYAPDAGAVSETNTAVDYSPADIAINATVDTEVDYTPSDLSIIKGTYTEVEYISVGTALNELTVMVEYKPPSDGGYTKTSAVLAEVEYQDNATIKTATTLVEWEGPPPSTESFVYSFGTQADTIAGPMGAVDSIGLNSSGQTASMGRTESFGVQAGEVNIDMGTVLATGTNVNTVAENYGSTLAYGVQVSFTDISIASSAIERIQGEALIKQFGLQSHSLRK